MQTSVNTEQAVGVIGSIVINGPQRGQPGILRSTDAANNVIGRAFYHITGDDLAVKADGPIVQTDVLAGVLANSKVYASFGNTTDGPLGPTIVLPNETNVELVTMTSGILVQLTNVDASNPRIGWLVGSALADGTLRAFPDQATLTGDAAYHNVAVGEIVRNNVEGSTANGVLAIMEMVS